MRKYWRLWCKTLGYKISKEDAEADFAAILRTIWIILNIVTVIAIILNTIHQW